MTDQAQRLEIATVRAEIGSNITYRFNNDAIDALLIPTDSGDIKNLKQVIADIQQEGSEKISFATKIYPTTAAGIAATVNGEIFLVASSDADEIYAVWQNSAGSAVDTGKRAISASAVIAATDAAQASADSAQSAATEATAKVAPFLSPAPADPIVRGDGSSLQPGDTYFNTAIQAIKVYSLSGWVAANVTGVELTAAINTREPSIDAGTSDQYWSGDKTFKTLDKAAVGLGNADNTSDANKPLSTAATTALSQKAPIASPAFTGTVSGVSKAMVGLSAVDNTSDASKPVSTAQQAALDLKANLNSPAFTGTVTGITKGMVGMGSVDNTSDANKPVSIAQQAALDLMATKTSLANTSGTGGASLIGFMGRDLGARLRDNLSVKDFGAKGDGVTNDSPAIQAAFDFVKARGYGTIYAPSGTYLLSAQVTAQDFHFAFFGDGQEQTIFLVNNTTGGIAFTSTGRTGTEWICSISGFTAVSYGAGAVSRGKAVSVVYPTTSFAPATPNCMVDNIHIRGMGYSINTSTDPYFTDGIYVRNASNSRIYRINSDQNANKLYTGINLDYPTTVGKFRVSVDSISLQGGLYGIRAVGAIENLLIDNYEIGVPVYGIFCDATGVGYQTPLVSVGRGHINATKYPFYAKNWKSIQITSPEIAVSYDAAYSGSSNAGVYVEGCNLLELAGGSINNIDSATTTSMVELVGTTNFTISAMTYNVNYVATKTQIGVRMVSGTRDGVISGCTAKASSTSTYAFAFAQVYNATDDGILVVSNRINGFDSALVSIDMRGLRFRGNDCTGCTSVASVAGQPYPGLVIEQNMPFVRSNITGNSATPNVAGIADGSLQMSNTSATTITNFTNGREGQVIELLAANANTTVQHNASIFLQGSTNFAMGAAALLTLRYSTGVWRELYRRTG